MTKDSNVISDQLNELENTVKENIIEILQSHNLSKVFLLPEEKCDDEDDDFTQFIPVDDEEGEDKFWKLDPIEGTGYDKNGQYLVKLTKMELVEKDEKVEIYPYGSSAGDVYDFGEFEGDHL